MKKKMVLFLPGEFLPKKFPQLKLPTGKFPLGRCYPETSHLEYSRPCH